MVFALTVGILTCLGLILLVFIKPSVQFRGEQISIYWLPPLAGALILISGGALSLQEVAAGLTAPTAMNPIKILILFFSMTLLSVFLDQAGFFRYLAETMLAKAGGSQKALFFTLYATVSVLTVFTSNDIIVLTFTPFICYFTRHAKVDPLPYLFCEFIAANTWSMIFIIGNPTNIYLASGADIGCFEYLKVMAWPTLLAGLGSLAALWLLFRKKLEMPLHQEFTPTARPDKPMVFLGVLHLGVCILLMVLSSVLELPMWLISLAAFCSLFVSAAFYLAARNRTPSILLEVIKRAPFEMAPFVLSMFIVVLALEKCGVTALLADLLGYLPAVPAYGISSFLASNFMNNIPMSVLYSGITAGATGAAPLYAAVIGSNLGAFFTPIGALAGMMWMQLLKAHGLQLSFGKFTKYGAAVAIPSLILALIGLMCQPI
ncbi:MAG: hypothetical protein IJ407_04750 [Clostridia bacterium]|nr:hypothetical protein [Clostridia bacterium]